MAAPVLGFTEPPAKNRTDAASITKNSRTRKLDSGQHKMEVFSQGLGCMGMSYHRSFIPDRKVSIALIRKAAEMGINFFDTAEAYGPYQNEELIGEALAPIR